MKQFSVSVQMMVAAIRCKVAKLVASQREELIEADAWMLVDTRAASIGMCRDCARKAVEAKHDKCTNCGTAIDIQEETKRVTVVSMLGDDEASEKAAIDAASVSLGLCRDCGNNIAAVVLNAHKTYRTGRTGRTKE